MTQWRLLRTVLGFKVLMLPLGMKGGGVESMHTKLPQSPSIICAERTESDRKE